MNNRGNKIYEIKKDNIFIASALILAGVLFCAFPGAGAVMICNVFAGVLCVWGVIRIISYLRVSKTHIFGSYGLVQGVLLILFAVLVFMNPGLFETFLMFITGMILVADGFLKVQYAVGLMRLKSGRWPVILAGAVIMIIAGAVVILNPFSTAEFIMIFAGATMIAEGITDIICVIFILRKVREMENSFYSDRESSADAQITDK